MVRIVSALSEISRDYDALFVDLWGCVHDGVRAIPSAVAALQHYRGSGGRVVLVTNAPRTRHSVARQLAQLGVPEDAWDAIATSGDSARTAMYRGIVGRKVWFMGEDRDLSFFEPPEVVEDPVDVRRADLEDAEGIVCIGPFDPLAEPEVVRPQLLWAKTHGLKLLCANPDIVVDRGDVREWCAGAIAQLYSEMGGESLYFGKPHPPIYDLARRRLAQVDATIRDESILCIGDGPQTDILGAMGEGLDSVFITGGLAREETKTTDAPDPDALTGYLNEERVAPTFAMGRLA